MSTTTDPDGTHFETEETRVYAVEHDVALYDLTNDQAWVACEDAPLLRDWT